MKSTSNFLLWALSLPLYFFLTSCQPNEEEIPDIIFINGKIYTADAERSWQNALAVKDGRILAIGKQDEIEGLKGESTQLIDLKGKLMLPGLHDAHLHPISGAEASKYCQLSDLLTPEDILDEIKNYVAANPDLDIIRGRGWEMSAFENSNPHKQLLDEIIPDKPAVFTSWDGHNFWANSKALEMAGITKDTPNPKNGRIEKDPVTGEPSGTLRETAMNLLSPILPKNGEEAVLDNLKLALSMANKLGITSMTEASAGEDYLKAYKTLDDQGLLTARIVTAIGLGMETPKTVAALVALRDKYMGRLLNTNSVKVFADGVPEARTAALLEPYLTDDGKEDYGILNFPLEVLAPLFDSLDKAGFQIHIHALGDKGVRVTLDALAPLDTSHRHQISHLQIIHPEDIARFGKQGVLANFQPYWAKGDPLNLRTIIPLVGPERSKQMYPMGSVEKTAGKFAAGSDWPVSTLNPWHAMQVAVTRQLIEGESKPWIPSEKVSLNTIVDAYTIHGAFSMHQEVFTGSLEKGKMADLIVLNQNIFEVDPYLIHRTEVLLTMLQGQIVYQHAANPLALR